MIRGSARIARRVAAPRAVVLAAAARPLFAAGVAALVVLAAAEGFGEDAGVRATASASARVIAVGDTFRLAVTVDWPEGVEVRPLAAPEKIGNFVVKDVDQGLASGGTRTASLLLTTFDTGRQAIPPLEVVYTRPDGSSGSVETQPLEVEVTSVLPEKVDDIRDIKRPISLPRRWRDIVLSYLLIVGLVGAAATSVVISFMRRDEIDAYLRRVWLRLSRPVINALLGLLRMLGLARGRGPAFDVEIKEPGLAPAAAALAELDRVEALGLVGRGLIRELYTLVSEVDRRYLERQSGILAMESPTSETLSALAARGLAGEVLELVRSVLEECDLVKFAKYVPAPASASSLVERSRRLVAVTADLVPAGETWFLSQRYAGADVRPGPGVRRGPGDEGGGEQP